MVIDDVFERSTEHLKQGLPFVIYRKPNESIVHGFFQKDDKLVFANSFEEKGFVFSPFDDIDKSVLFPLQNSTKVSSSFFATSSLNKHFENSPNLQNEDKTKYMRLVEKAIETIKTSELEKVVISRKEAYKINDSSPLDIFKNLLSTYDSAFVYYWYHPKIGTWLGATPETLLKIEGKRFSMMALAGTQNYNDTLDVSWGDKELEEQQYVTDYIVNNINSSVNNVTVSDVKTVKAGNLVHLRTMIIAQLSDEISLKDVITSIHPTPAVCGVPKIEAKRFIQNHENYNRGYYTGFLGELNLEKEISPRSSKRNIENRAYATKKRSTQLYVNLRCMEFLENEAQIYVGGGITQGSNPEDEWQETVLKSRVMKKALQ